MNSQEEIIPFMSFVSFRDTHRELLKRRRDQKGKESEEFWVAVEEFLQRGEAAGSFLDIDDDRAAAQNLLDYWQNQLFHADRETPEAILNEFDPSLQPEIPDDRCPYIGLSAFNDANSHLFYGRSQLIDELLNQCLVSRLVAAVGPSGSGKSSVVLAGLVPKLKSGELPGSALWRYYPTIVPSSAPLSRLAHLLQPEGADTADWITETIENLRSDPDHLTQLVDTQGSEPGVIIIDQFEETFTLCHDDEERDAFINNLLSLIRTREPRHLVILTMRVDYESYLTKVPLFQSLFEQGQVRVAAMTAAELHEAIEQPAEMVGLKFEEGLVDALVREIVGEPAALPLLQFALLQLWDNRERNRVTWQNYRRLGGVLQALANTADQIYENLLPEEQVTAKRILLRLVRPSEGVEFTRRRVPRRQLYQSGEAHDRLDRVLDKLVQARLIHSTEGVNADEDQIEVAHEALVRNWPRLVEWLEDERVVLRHRLRLTRQAEEWDARGRDEDTLLRGIMLQEASQYEHLNPLEAEFVKASQDLVRKEEEAKEAVRKRELEQARQLAAEQKRVAEVQALAAQRARTLNIALVAILVLVIGAFIAINGFQNIAQARAAEAAESAAQAAQAAAEAQSTSNAADLLAVESTAQAIEAFQSHSTATAEVATSQWLSSQRQIADSNKAATAAAETATVGYATAEAEATEFARQATVTPTAAETTAADALQTMPPPDPRQLRIDAQLKGQLRPHDNMQMLFIMGGTFEMGSNVEADEQPIHEVSVGDFLLDQFEISVEQYADFLNEIGGYRGACDGFDCALTGFDTRYTFLLNNFGFFEPLPGTEDLPATWISWYGAREYCRHVEARLPTEAEWEYAARSPRSNTYPWGAEEPEEDDQALFGFTDPVFDFEFALLPVDEFPEGTSPFGAFGMAGSVWEWVEDWYDPDYYSTAPSTAVANDNDATGEKVLRGGGWESEADELRSSNRYHLEPAIGDPDELLYLGVGFRCARGVE